MIDRVGRVYVEKLGFSVTADVAYADGSYRVPPMVWFRDQDGNTLLLVEERPGR